MDKIKNFKKYESIKKRSKYSKLNTNEYYEIRNEKKSKKNELILVIQLIILIALIFIIFGIFYFYYLKKGMRDKEKREIENYVYQPILPFKNEGYAVKKYSKSEIPLVNKLYNFKNLYNERKIFKINYCYIPYEKINKSISYEENADIIYN